MSKKNKKSKQPLIEDTTSVAKDIVVDETANSNLADFAKQKKAKEDKAAEAKAAKAPKVGKDGKPKLPPLPRKAGSPKPLKPCQCGCGMTTRADFAPGHDSRLRGWALRIARDVLTLDDMVKVYKASEGERAAVEAHIKQLKKEGKYEALKTAQVSKKKAVSE